MIRDKVLEIVAYNSFIDISDIEDDNRFVEDLGMDSLDIFDMCIDVEDEFGIEIGVEKASKIKTVKDLINIAEARM